jgi:tetratricopeptide (TPR) repeat protein
MRGNARYSKSSPGAIEDFTKSIELSPDYAEGYFMRASCHYILKAYAPAEKDYTVAIAKKPGYTEAYYWRCNARINLGKKKEALDDINKALELDPGNSTYLMFQKNNFK